MINDSPPSNEHMTSHKMNMKTWDIFCRVIDNYGDIGVCWRLARQLANEHNLCVRLWVDEIAALKQIWPATQLVEMQILAQVQVCIWAEDFTISYTPDVVIEAFACHLPETYVAQMKHSSTPPYWLNLEYLSAEDWVEGCHQLTSMHPQNGLKKTFFFPGFNEKTGGLLREYNLLSLRDDFMATNKKFPFLSTLGINNISEDALIISLFSYENSALASLLHVWRQSPCPIICLVPTSKTLTSINAALKLQLSTGDTYHMGSLQLTVIPFLTQLDYDHLLWACDINFVRGEDSFVRAQWAAKPFVWHIYPQEDAAHLIKLDAFVAHYTQTAEPTLAMAIKGFWLDWNTGKDCSNNGGWLLKHLQSWNQHSQAWCKNLSLTPDLAANLVRFCQKTL